MEILHRPGACPVEIDFPPRILVYPDISTGEPVVGQQIDDFLVIELNYCIAKGQRGD